MVIIVIRRISLLTFSLAQAAQPAILSLWLSSSAWQGGVGQFQNQDREIGIPGLG